jgi:L-ascorbate metabolism protein UlaG (beta-lactamase superfamily)
MHRAAILLGALAACGGGSGIDAGGDGDDGGGAIDASTEDAMVLTWAGVTTWLLQYRDTAVLLDAYTSRQPWSSTGGNADGAELLAEMVADSGADGLDAALIGHSHFDHAFDLFAALCPIHGSQTTCHLATTQGAGDRCSVVGDGDSFAVGELTVRVLRLPHSFPNSLGRFEELDAPLAPKIY